MLNNAPNDAASDVFTNYYAIDLKTDITYGLRLDAAGNCSATQVMTTATINKQGEVKPVSDPEATSPFGKTITAIEMSANATKKVFTMVWPSEEDFGKGSRPAVTMKDLPQDLVKAGIAAAPKSAEGVVDMDTALKSALGNIDHMIGLTSAKRDIRQNIAVARFNQVKMELELVANPISRNMVFFGNPGTGKTTFAKEVAKVYHALGFIPGENVKEVTSADLVADVVGGTQIKTMKVINEVKKEGGILFIDEAYSLASTGTGREGNVKAFGKEAIDTLVAEMDKDRSFIVVVAGYPEPMKQFIDTNPGLKSRFMTYINFEDYSVEQLGEILDLMIADRGYKLEPDARAYAMSLLEKEKARVEPKDFANGRIVRNLVEMSEKLLAERLEREGKLGKGHGLTREELKAAVSTFTLADLKGVSLDSLTSKGEAKKSMSFDTAQPRKTPANDVAPALVTEPASARRAAKAAFRP